MCLKGLTMKSFLDTLISALGCHAFLPISCRSLAGEAWSTVAFRKSRFWIYFPIMNAKPSERQINLTTLTYGFPYELHPICFLNGIYNTNKQIKKKPHQSWPLSAAGTTTANFSKASHLRALSPDTVNPSSSRGMSSNFPNGIYKLINTIDLMTCVLNC